MESITPEMVCRIMDAMKEYGMIRPGEVILPSEKRIIAVAEKVNKQYEEKNKSNVG